MTCLISLLLALTVGILSWWEAIGGAPPVELTVHVAPAYEAPDPYERQAWGRGEDADGDCQYTRHEVLIAESLDSVTFTSDDECWVEAGRWYGVYTGQTFTDPSRLDIDHMVPLANAWVSGAWEWDDDRRKAFYNDIEHDEHLRAVSASANRSKWKLGPEDWRPPNEGHWCQYARDWISIKNRWSLTVTEREADALEDMLAVCSENISLSEGSQE